MIRLMMTLVLSLGVAGCQSVKYPLPSCDGYSKRPLNKSMWNWERPKAQLQERAFLPKSWNPPAFAAFAAFDNGSAATLAPDNPDSNRSCA